MNYKVGLVAAFCAVLLACCSAGEQAPAVTTTTEAPAVTTTTEAPAVTTTTEAPAVTTTTEAPAVTTTTEAPAVVVPGVFEVIDLEDQWGDPVASALLWLSEDGEHALRFTCDPVEYDIFTQEYVAAGSDDRILMEMKIDEGQSFIVSGRESSNNHLIIPFYRDRYVDKFAAAVEQVRVVVTNYNDRRILMRFEVPVEGNLVGGFCA